MILSKRCLSASVTLGAHVALKAGHSNWRFFYLTLPFIGFTVCVQ